jgi:hypothetical protein
MRYTLFWYFTQRKLVSLLVTDVSGQHICTTFKGQAVQEEFRERSGAVIQGMVRTVIAHRAPHTISFFIPFPFFGFSFSIIFLVLILFLCFTSPLSAPPSPRPLYLRAPPRKIYFLPLFPSSKSTTLHQLSWLASLSLRINHCPQHFQYKCAPNCSRPCWHIESCPTGTFRLTWLRVSRAFSSVVRKMPGYNSQRRDTARTLPKLGG